MYAKERQLILRLLEESEITAKQVVECIDVSQEDRYEP